MTQLWYGAAAAMLAITITITDSSHLPAQEMPAELSVAAHHMAASVIQVQPGASAVWDKVIAIDLDDVTLEEALEAIGKAAGVDVTYSRNVIPYKKRVTVQLERVAVREAFRLSLQGTGTEARLSPAGDVIIARARDSQSAQGVITGRIVHAKTKQPVVGATVLVDDESKGVTTGSDGAFRISVGVGERRITVRAVGFVRQAKTVTVTEGETITIEVALEPSASVLDEVVVTGSVIATERKAIPTPITVITAEEIERRGITHIEQFFHGEVPGVIALDEGAKRYVSELGAMQSSKIYGRGVSTLEQESNYSKPNPNPLKTYIDGVEMLDPAYLGTIDPQSIERIEIITGPQAATLYGAGAMGGVMQIFTKKGAGSSGIDATANLQYGMLQSNLSKGRTPRHSHALSVRGGAAPEFSYAGTLSYNYSGQWRPAFFSRTVGGSVGVTHSHGPLVASGSIAYTAGTNGTTDMSWLNTIFMQDRGEWRLQNNQLIRGLNRKIAKSSNQTGSLNLDYQPMSWWQHHLVIGRTITNFGIIPEAPQFRQNWDTLYQSSSSSGHQTTASYNTTIVPRLPGPLSASLTVGASSSSGTQTTIYGWLTTESSSSLEDPMVSRSLNTENWGGFGQLRVGLFDQLFVTMGLRGEHSPNYGESHKVDWTPTNGIAYSMAFGDLTVKLLGSYGRVTRTPAEDRKIKVISVRPEYEPAQYVSQIANPNLTPEYSKGPQGGIELYYENVASLTINRYKQTVTDLLARETVEVLDFIYLPINLETIASVYQWRNAAKIRQHGWETTGSLNIGSLAIKGTYSWNDSRVLESRTGGFDVGQSFFGIPTHMANISMNYAFGKNSITWVTNYVGTSTQRYVDGNLTIKSWVLARLPMYEPKQTRTVDHWNVPGYAKSDFIMTHRISPGVSLTMNMTNVGNSYANDVGEGSPSIGRQTLLGVSLRR